MGTRLPRLSTTVRDWFRSARGEFFALLAVVVFVSASDSTLPVAVHAQEVASSETPTSGDRLIQTVASHIAQYDSIAAQIRYKARLFDIDLVGSGVYLQQGRAVDRRAVEQGLETPMRTRLELKTQTRGGANSLLEINTGRYLYRQRRVGEVPKIDRVVLRRVRREWAAVSGSAFSGSTGPAEFESPQLTLAMGGLPKLVTSLSVSFRFDEARSVQLNKNMPGFEVVGHWRRKKLAEMLPGQCEQILSGKKADLSQLPSHIPHEVAVSVGSADFFPHVFEYRRFLAEEAMHGTSNENEKSTNGRKEESDQTASKYQQVVLFQILKVVTNGPIDESQFKFPYDNSVDVPDRTEAFLPKKSKR